MEARRQVALAFAALAALSACAKKPAVPAAAPTPGPAGPQVPPLPRPATPGPPPESRILALARDAQGAFSRGVAMADGDPSRAIEAFKQAVGLNPKMHIAHYNLGVLYERIGDDALAERHYRECLRSAGDYAPALHNLVNLLLRRGQPSRAVEVASEAAAKHPARLDLRHLKVKALSAAWQVAAATQEAKAILREDEKNVGAMLALAGIYYGQGKYELAAHACRQALKVDPENPSAHHRLGHALLKLGEKAKALESFQKAVELKRDFPEALNSLGMMLLESGDVGRALNYLEEAVRLSPNFVAALLNLGNAYRKGGDLQRAKSSYERVLQLRPGFADALYNLALLYLDHPMPDAPDEIRRIEVALGFFSRYRDAAGRLRPDDPASRYVFEASRKLEQLRKAEARRLERERLKKLKQEMEGRKLGK
jgi:tetratricopeptide (TPR) repeat protein